MTLRTDLHVEQGADYSVDLPALDGLGRPRTLLGWTGQAAIRLAPDSPLILSPPIVVRPGTVHVTIPGGTSTGWAWRRAVYEILLHGPQGQRERFATGRVHLDRSLL